LNAEQDHVPEYVTITLLQIKEQENAEQDHVSGHVTIILPQMKEQANCTDSYNDIKMAPDLIGLNGPCVMSHVEQEQSHASGQVIIILWQMMEQIAQDLTMTLR